MKANRVQYRRNWAAANTTLERASVATPSNNDDDESIELSLNFVSPPSESDSESDLEQHEPSPKRVCQSTQPTSPLHDDYFHGNDHSLSDLENDNSKDSLQEGLVSWANKFMVKQNALDGLFCLLKNNGHSELPTCARTLLQTCRTVSIRSKSGMEYIYFPLATQLLKHFKGYPAEAVSGLETSINVDGLPLFKSSNKTLWPVLCAIVNVTPIVVFPVVLTCGKSKPDDLEFLDELVNDLDNVLKNGIEDENRVISVSLKCIVCDAPARALVNYAQVILAATSVPKRACGLVGSFILKLMTLKCVLMFPLGNKSMRNITTVFLLSVICQLIW